MNFPYSKMRTPALEKYVHWQPHVPQDNNRRTAVGGIWQVPIISLRVKSCHSRIKLRSWPSDPSVGFALHRSRVKNICVSSQHETWLFNDSWGQRDAWLFIHTDPCIINTQSLQNRARTGSLTQQPSLRSQLDWFYLMQQGQEEVYYPFTSSTTCQISQIAELKEYSKRTLLECHGAKT